MSSAIRRKRQYQPSISTFFAPVPYDNSKSNGIPAEPPGPILPDSVQSSLLNVGMRVRKAVPEGYKNKKSFDESTYKSQPQLHGRHLATIGNNSAGRGAELIPFCGIMKVGGHDFQDFQETSYDADDTSNFYNETLPTMAFVASERNDSSFPSSQESNISTISTDSTPAPLTILLPTRDKKRAFDEHNDENADKIFDNAAVYTSENAFVQHGLPRRPLASGWRRRFERLRRRAVSSRSTATSILELDFGEAEFLRFGNDEGEQMEVDNI